jgi:uncharacterized Zn-finger protein
MISSLLKNKKIDCFYCKTKFPAKKAYDFEMMTAEGKHSVKLCPICSTIVENIIKDRDDGNLYPV